MKKDFGLFRGKRLDNREWVEGYLIYDERDHLYRIVTKLEYSTGTFIDTGFAPRVDSETVCRYTGVEDKGDKKWEGDIFQYDDDTYVISWCKQSLMFEAVSISSSEALSLGEFRASEIWVIGNAFDNTELLEVEEND